MVDRSKSWGVVVRTSPAATSKTTTLTVKKMIRRRTTCALDQTLSGGLAASAGALLPAGEQVACHARTEARGLLKRKRPSSLKAGAVNLTSGGLWGLNPEGWLNLRQVCEALNTREGRNLGTDATQSWLQRMVI